MRPAPTQENERAAKAAADATAAASDAAAGPDTVGSQPRSPGGRPGKPPTAGRSDSSRLTIWWSDQFDWLRVCERLPTLSLIKWPSAWTYCWNLIRPAKRHVSAANLDKTHRLVGQAIHDWSRRNNVSAGWTDIPPRIPAAEALPGWLGSH